MYSTIEDFITDWQIEAESTLKIFAAIPEEKKSEKIKENIRSLERLAWHITQTLTEMPFRAAILDEDYLDKRPIPENFAEILDTFKEYNEEFIRLLREKWTGLDLTEKIEVYGQQWERRKILMAMTKHQIHHRAQMTMVMRMLDIKVPGLYGPSKEEWSIYGMEPQE